MADNYGRQEFVPDAASGAGKFVIRRSIEVAAGIFADALVLIGADGLTPASASNPLPIGSAGGGASAGYSASASFTPAAAGHTAPASVGVAAEFVWLDKDGNPPPTGAHLIITSADLIIAGASAEATAWRLEKFSVTPPSALADTGAWVLPSGDRASYLGHVDLGTAVDKVDTQWVQTDGINRHIKLAGVTSFGYLTNLTTLTPAAVAHTVALRAIAV